MSYIHRVFRLVVKSLAQIFATEMLHYRGPVAHEKILLSYFTRKLDGDIRLLSYKGIIPTSRGDTA